MTVHSDAETNVVDIEAYHLFSASYSGQELFQHVLYNSVHESDYIGGEHLHHQSLFPHTTVRNLSPLLSKACSGKQSSSGRSDGVTAFDWTTFECNRNSLTGDGVGKGGDVAVLCVGLATGAVALLSIAIYTGPHEHVEDKRFPGFQVSLDQIKVCYRSM